MALILFIGTLTAFIAGINALLEVDLKKIIALSTLSQLGLIVATLGAGAPILAYFHIMVHALFKAILFICRGKFIHLLDGNQDLRQIGGNVYSFPVTGLIINLANYALIGFPFLAGFYSKDLLLEDMLRKN